MGATRATTVIGIGVLTVMLSACAPPAPLVERVDPRPSSTAPAAVATPGTSAPRVSDSGPCSEVSPSYPVLDATDPEQLGGRTLTIPHDRGLFDTATGEATVDASGVPVAYVAAPGDVFSTIAARFCLSEDLLQILNHARRDNNALYAGDTLNLDPHTIFTVGDQNGVVSDNEFPDWFTLPPQR
ncbi:LysM peptidoglycan-binding domain-containing protein [Microbacterium sp. NPDC090007]|uniref:LysM peptidoglycan-binding domain-containing protein n=1 Tax=Microbacterium sp. NPDC090007 TaxID=3364204 RepID=UPI0037F90FA8